MKAMKIQTKKLLHQSLMAVVFFGLGFGVHKVMNPRTRGGWPMAGEVAVSVQNLTTQDLTDKKKFIASVEAINSVNIVPQISGYIQEVRFKDGAFVQAGDILFVIEQSKFLANVKAAEADLEKANSDFSEIYNNYRRQEQLYKEKITPKAAMEAAENKLNQAKASIKQAEANLTLAKINLDYTEIKAPISGYIGKVLVTKGNYVSPSVANLARIVQTDPIRIAFSISDKDRLAFLTDVHGKNTQTHFEIVHPNHKVVEVEADNFFADNEINAETATLPVYLDYKNPENALIPGNYVDVLIRQGDKKQSLVVPVVAVSQDINGTYVMVVGADHVVKQTYVELGKVVGQVQEVLSGLNPSDQVIVQGLQKVQDGTKVKPILVK